MIAITLQRTLLRSSVSRSRFCISCAKRNFASSPPPSHSATPVHSASMLGTLTGELDKLAPRFEIHANQIRILRAPTEFYETLKERILKAEKRVFLSTLYIGKTEHDLIDTLRQALRRQPNLQVSILSDALRGTREAPSASCASLLTPLIEEFGDRVEIRMYHTPNLRGLRKQIVPKRLNEGWGLQHMKLYGIDDEIIISGANLSDDYFRNRQDRYHVFSSKDLTNYFARIHYAICSISYRVLPAPIDVGGFTLEWPVSNPAPQPTENPTAFKISATSILGPLIRPATPAVALPQTSSRTVIYPLAQFTPLMHPTDISTEHPGLLAVLRLLSRPDWATSKWMFTAGYFNIHSELKRLLLESKSVEGTVVTAAPEANGFYGSKGVSSMLPPAYTLLARRFLTDVVKMGKGERIHVREWMKGGAIGKDPDAWTYHAKGIWVTQPQDENPSITLVGSSNYTKRSYSLDLEVNALIVTEDDGLKKQLGEEVEWLQKDSRKVGMEDFERVERRVSLKVRLALWLVGAIGGQL